MMETERIGEVNRIKYDEGVERGIMGAALHVQWSVIETTKGLWGKYATMGRTKGMIGK